MNKNKNEKIKKNLKNLFFFCFEEIKTFQRSLREKNEGINLEKKN